MIIVLKPETSKKDETAVLKEIRKLGYRPHVMRGVERTAARRAQELGPGKWIVIYVWGPEGTTLEEWQKMFNPSRSSLTRQFLDSVAPQNPLIVFTSTAPPDVWAVASRCDVGGSLRLPVG